MRRALPAVPLLLVLASPVLAGPAAAPDDPRLIDPFLRFEAPAGLPGAPVLIDGTPAQATLIHPSLDDDARRALEARGLTFVRLGSGALAHVGDVYVVEAVPDVLRRLAREGLALQVARPMLDDAWATNVTAEEIEVPAMLAAGPTPADGFDGEGVRVLDLDSGLDVYHPHFFAADGGAFAWIDDDGDGELTIGIDGIDLDGNGNVGDPEEFQLLEGWTFGYDPDVDDWVTIGMDDGYDFARDFLYLDANENGRRDYTGAQGFTDEDPGFGEMLFVADDADGDGRFEPDERVLLLGTSRFRAVVREGVEYRRGENLSEYPHPGNFDVATHDTHATGVLGIVAGGRPGRSEYPGLLPRADLLAWVPMTSAEVVVALAWGDAEGADVAIHEYAPWYTHFLDGSESGERAVDNAMDDGFVQVCAAGNLATAGKHTSAYPTDGDLTFRFTVPESADDATYGYATFDLHASGGDTPPCTITLPDGSVHDLVPDGDENNVLPGVTLWSADSVSARGNLLFLTYLYVEDDTDELPAGEYTVSCATDRLDRYHAFVNDFISGWGRGVVLDGEDDASTMGFPSTADECIAVGAYVGRAPTWDDLVLGDPHDYSSQGPRIHPPKTIDVVAPADAYTPWAQGNNVPGVAYQVFGGTSGASPHAAAVAAQLVQALPDATGVEIRDLLQAGAVVDDQLGVDGDDLPHDRFGHGKVRSFRSWTDGDDPPDALPRTLEVTADFTSERRDGECHVTATPIVRGRDDATFRWDWAYDGRWDGGFAAGDLSYVIEPGTELAVRMQGAVDGWIVGDGLALWTVPDACVEGVACGGGGCTTGDSGSGRTPAAALLALCLGLLVRTRRRAARPR